MELFQTFVVDLVWVFFAAWGTTLAALAVIIFKPDILTRADRTNVQSNGR
jgi:hypothetical protein